MIKNLVKLNEDCTKLIVNLIKCNGFGDSKLINHTVYCNVGRGLPHRNIYIWGLWIKKRFRNTAQ